jgi:hypothetical protein
MPSLGVVLNRLAQKQTDAYSYYDYAGAQPRAQGKTRGGTTRRAQPRQTQGRRQYLQLKVTWV